MQELFFGKAPLGSYPVVPTRKEIFSRNLSFPRLSKIPFGAGLKREDTQFLSEFF